MCFCFWIRVAKPARWMALTAIRAMTASAGLASRSAADPRPAQLTESGPGTRRMGSRHTNHAAARWDGAVPAQIGEYRDAGTLLPERPSGTRSNKGGDLLFESAR